MTSENIVIETHPLPPFAPPHAKLLMLGSFPPPRGRWKMDFYYPNFNNDMWRIFGLVFFGDQNHFIDGEHKKFKEPQLREFLYAKGIAIYDIAYRIKRLQGNAADKFLQIVQPIDLATLLASLPDCHHLITTGELATQTLLSLLPKDTPKPTIHQSSQALFNGRKLHLYRLPSSSRAYPLSLPQKAAAYGACFRQTGLLQAT